MEPTFSPAWFATFGRPDPATTAREVDYLASVLPQPPATVLDVPCGFGRHARALATRGYPDGSRDSFEWRLYEPEELSALGKPAGLRLDLVCADFSEKPPTSETPRTQLVFRRDTQARCENQQPASSSRKTQAFWPDSSTRSK